MSSVPSADLFQSAHKLVLDALGVQTVAAVVGGSMGGMAALEWYLSWLFQHYHPNRHFSRPQRLGDFVG